MYQTQLEQCGTGSVRVDSRVDVAAMVDDKGTFRVAAAAAAAAVGGGGDSSCSSSSRNAMGGGGGGGSGGGGTNGGDRARAGNLPSPSLSSSPPLRYFELSTSGNPQAYSQVTIPR